jgi:hypothetical protein
MTTITKADIKKSTTTELLAFYNAHSGRGEITKFQDRATAEKRVRQLIDMLAGADSPSNDVPAAETTTAEQPKVKATKVKATKPAKEPKAKAEKQLKQPKAPKAPADRAAAISKSWSDPKTHAARSARNGCKVSGEVYTSVPAAFRVLKLDMKKCQRVRRDMVLNGHTTFEGTRFTLVRE